LDAHPNTRKVAESAAAEDHSSAGKLVSVRGSAEEELLGSGKGIFQIESRFCHIA
jgi:hypothetical protein